MHRFSRLSAGIVPFRLLSAHFSIQIRFCPVFPDEIEIFLYWAKEVFLYAKFFKIMNSACISVWPQFKL